MSRHVEITAKVEGMAQFCALTGFTLAEAKAAKKTPDGAKCFTSGTRIDRDAFSRAINAMRRDGGEIVLTESQARTAKIISETAAIDRENALADGVIQKENDVDQKIRHELLMPLRDGLQGLQKKYHRLKASQPDIATKILENDLPMLVEKLSAETK